MAVNSQMSKVQRALSSWDNLNAYLMKLETSAEAMRILEEERNGRNRAAFMSRIYSRFSRLRKDEELHKWGLNHEL